MNDGRRVRLTIPALVDRPAIGTSCCVTTAEALIAQELWMLPGITDTRIEPFQGWVDVSFDPDSLSLDELERALDEIGYPIASLEELANDLDPAATSAER